MEENLLEYRMNVVEKDMAEVKKALQELKDKGVDPKIYVAIVGFLGVAFSTIGSVLGTVLTAYLTK